MPAELEEEVLALWTAESLGAEVSEAPEGTSRLRLYFSTPEAATAALAPTLAWLERHGAGDRSLAARARPVEDERWAERYIASLAAFPVGRGFLVVPAEMQADPAGREPIRLPPGRAFGTGEHPTTRFAIEALEELVEPGNRWLDVGTGSGILAVVAVRRGAGFMAACDTDPDALEVARETLRANGLAGRVVLRLGSADLFTAAAFDGSVANIAADFFLERASHLAAVLRPGGLLVATGFLAEDGAAIEEALAANRLETVRRRESEGWSLLVARRAPP